MVLRLIGLSADLFESVSPHHASLQKQRDAGNTDAAMKTNNAEYTSVICGRLIVAVMPLRL